MVNKELADLSVLLITLVATPLFCLSLFRHPDFSQKKGFILFLSFLAMYPLLNMVGHIIAISIISYFSYQDGTFFYDFRFYSLILYGVVFLLINGYSLYCIKHLSRGNQSHYTPLIRINLLQIILISPSFVLNPIALLPSIASLLIIFRLVVAKRSREKEKVSTPNYSSSLVETV